MSESTSDYAPNPNRYDGSMNYRRCGNSGILLPEISLGLWHNFGGTDSFSNSQRMLHHAFDKGITHFDLANNYGVPFGSAEKTFGEVMSKSFAPYRSELIISTKAGHSMWAGPYGDGGSRKNLMNSIDQSLQRMNLDYVDIFYSHRFDPETPLEETLQALVDIVKQGKALYIGISKYPTDAAKFAYEYLRARDVNCLIYQGKYNILNQEVEEKGILDQARKNGAGFIAFSPLAQGLLTDKYIDGNITENSRMARSVYLNKEELTPALLNNIKELNKIANKRNQTLAEMALSWVLRNDNVTSVIIGASSVEQIDRNLNALKNKAFSIDDLFSINQLVKK